MPNRMHFFQGHDLFPARTKGAVLLREVCTFSSQDGEEITHPIFPQAGDFRNVGIDTLVGGGVS